MSAVVTIVLVVLAAAVQPPASLGDDPATFDAQIDRAIVERDVAFLRSVAADDARFRPSPSAAWTKQQWLDAVTASRDIERTREAVEVERHDDVAVTSGRFRVKAASGTDQGFYVRVYVRRSGRWLFLAQQIPPGMQIGSATGIPPSSGAVRAGNGVTLPRLLHEVRPNYTAEALKAKIKGAVFLDCVVLPDGSVGEVTVTKSLDKVYGLDEEAIKAAKQWRFEPGMRDGRPVPVLVSIELTFTTGKND